MYIRVVVSVLLVSLGGCVEPSRTPPADTILLNAEIYTSNPRAPWASAVAIRDGRFVYVGDDVTAFVGPETDVYDLAQKMVIPGLIDGHTHPGLVAMSHSSLLLDDVSSREALLASVRKLVDENPEREVLIGGYWPNELFGPEGPHKALLDEIEAERPLILYDSWAHTIWANSKALELGHVDAGTEDIVPGFSFYQKDENGEPTGWITESAASVFINQFQEVTPEVETVLTRYLEYFRDVGVTTILDAGNFGREESVYRVVRKLDDEGRLPVRYHGSYTLFVPQDLTGAVAKVTELNETYGSDRFRIDNLKIFLDGVLETRTAAIEEDYLDTPANNGEALLTRRQLHQVILQLEDAGYNLHVHSVGDRGTTMTLDAVQDAHNSLGRKLSIRVAICHLEVVKDSDYPRFSQLGVIANFTPHWWVGGDRSWVEQGIGEKANHMQRAQPLIADGAVVTFSSDNTDTYEWHRDRSSPFVGMEMGHNRQEIGSGPGGEVLPPLSDRLTRQVMLGGYTSSAAYQLGREDEFGAIRVGLRADLVVLDQHLFKTNRFNIHKTKPLVVVVNGSVVSGEFKRAVKP